MPFWLLDEEIMLAAIAQNPNRRITADSAPDGTD